MSKNGIFLSVANSQEGAEPRIVTESDPLPVADYQTQIGRGKVTDVIPSGSYGERTTAGAETNRVIWPNGTFDIVGETGVQMSIVSTSADDDAAGTNVQTVEIHYLDGNLDRQSEIVSLDGLTPVLTTATDIRFIDCMHIQTYGTTAAAAGDITASNGGTTYSLISTGDVRCSSSARMVPRGKKIYVAGAVGGSTSGTAAAGSVIRIAASELDNHQYLNDDFMLIPFGAVSLQDSSESFNFPVPVPFNAGTVIAMMHTTDKAATVTGSWYGWEETI